MGRTAVGHAALVTRPCRRPEPLSRRQDSCAGAALGAVAAIQTAGKAGKVLVAGFDNIGALQPMLADGRVVATADQHGDQLAVFGIEAALKILKGQAPPADQTPQVDLITK